MQRFPLYGSKVLDAAHFLRDAKISPADLFWHENALRIDETLPGTPGGETFDNPTYTGDHPGMQQQQQQHNVTIRRPRAEKFQRCGQGQRGVWNVPASAIRLCQPRNANWHSALKFFKSKVAGCSCDVLLPVLTSTSCLRSHLTIQVKVS